LDHLRLANLDGLAAPGKSHHWFRGQEFGVQFSEAQASQYVVPSRFKLPDHLRLANYDGLTAPGDEVHRDGGGSGVAAHFKENIDASLTWAFMDWLRGITNLPILVKVLPGLVSAPGIISARTVHLAWA
jgi:hypothetical protein